MTPKKSKLLVIDTSVIQSAGVGEHPNSSACREVLLLIYKICHHVAMNADIRSEWNHHMSRFSRKWQFMMAARKKPMQYVALQ